MQSIKRVIVYTIAAWLICMSLGIGMHALLPASHEALLLLVSMQTALLAAAAVLFTVLYLRSVKEGSLKEGFLVGLSATAIIIVLDVVHNLALSIDLGDYFAVSVPTYFIIPLTTALVIGYLKKK